MLQEWKAISPFEIGNKYPFDRRTKEMEQGSGLNGVWGFSLTETKSREAGADI
ncbi:hypothetical protein [Salibacterium salarium]|uniref:hypothetical protein n=1 Tax=Salibacterium salarium TaxID=284579 RepID=UPI001639785D|nr:hypothetical protein [Salibacterium salarium]